MYPVNEGVVEVLQKRAKHYRNRAQDERNRFGDLAREMTLTLEAIEKVEERAAEFELAAIALMEKSK